MGIQCDASFTNVGPKIWKVLPTYFRYFLSWISSSKVYCFFFSFCHTPPVLCYSVATNNNGPVGMIPLHGRGALEKLLQIVTDVLLAGFDTSQKTYSFSKPYMGNFCATYYFVLIYTRFFSRQQK